MESKLVPGLSRKTESPNFQNQHICSHALDFLQPSRFFLGMPRGQHLHSFPWEHLALSQCFSRKISQLFFVYTGLCPVLGLTKSMNIILSVPTVYYKN